MNSILEQSTFIPRDELIIQKASARGKIGNPPGKGSKIGDEINWESLLFRDEIQDLIIVSKDADFQDDLDNKKIHTFLRKEWKDKKSADVSLYTDFDLFAKKFLSLELANMHETIDKHIRELELSRAFTSTHTAISSLYQYLDYLRNNQAERITEAYLSNNQINWIISDDVSAFIRAIIDKHPTLEKIQKLNELLNQE